MSLSGDAGNRETQLLCCLREQIHLQYAGAAKTEEHQIVPHMLIDGIASSTDNDGGTSQGLAGRRCTIEF